MPLFRNPWRALSWPQVVVAVEVDVVDVVAEEVLLPAEEAALLSVDDAVAGLSAAADSVFALLSLASDLLEASPPSEVAGALSSDDFSAAFFWPPSRKSVTYQPEPLS
ncbi:MAG: hypothetical protein ACKOQV_00125 [Betaproteobacteria bacterium]